MLPDNLNSENIAHITSEFWGSMTSVALSVVPNLPPPPDSSEGVLGSIEIRGRWAGEVELRATRNLAVHTAAQLLDKQVEQVTVEECFDAIQEATNIVAGGIKRLLPPICKMAIPSMSGCGNLQPRGLGPDAILTFFTSDAGELSVLVRPF